MKASQKKTNKRLASAIVREFGSVANLCKIWPKMQSKQKEVMALIDLTKSPITKGGSYCATCRRLCVALGFLEEKLFPQKLYKDVLPAWVKPGTRLSPKLFSQKKTGPKDVEVATREELKRKIEKVLCTLPFREREIIKLRFGLGDGYTFTLEEVGHIFRLSGGRIRQIENKAVRKLQQPTRSQILVSFID